MCFFPQELKGYDSHHIWKKAGKLGLNINLITND